MIKLMLKLVCDGNTDEILFQDGASPLWIACQMGHLAIVQEMLQVGAEVDTPREVRQKV